MENSSWEPGYLRLERMVSIDVSVAKSSHMALTFMRLVENADWDEGGYGPFGDPEEQVKAIYPAKTGCPFKVTRSDDGHKERWEFRDGTAIIYSRPLDGSDERWDWYRSAEEVASLDGCPRSAALGVARSDLDWARQMCPSKDPRFQPLNKVEAIADVKAGIDRRYLEDLEDQSKLQDEWDEFQAEQGEHERPKDRSSDQGD